MGNFIDLCFYQFPLAGDHVLLIAIISVLSIRNIV